jgi:hypothetical protein
MIVVFCLDTNLLNGRAKILLKTIVLLMQNHKNYFETANKSDMFKAKKILFLIVNNIL